MCDVAEDELAFDGLLECSAHDHVHLEDGLRCEAGVVAATGGGERLVERVEMIGTQASQWDVTDGGVDVALDEPRVPVCSRGAYLSTLQRGLLHGWLRSFFVPAWPGGKAVPMPTKFPSELKRDVVVVARRGDLTLAEVDVSVESVRRWMRRIAE
jgi:hypothetical protein